MIAKKTTGGLLASMLALGASGTLIIPANANEVGTSVKVSCSVPTDRDAGISTVDVSYPYGGTWQYGTTLWGGCGDVYSIRRQRHACEFAIPGLWVRAAHTCATRRQIHRPIGKMASLWITTGYRFSSQIHTAPRIRTQQSNPHRHHTNHQTILLQFHRPSHIRRTCCSICVRRAFRVDSFTRLRDTSLAWHENNRHYYEGPFAVWCG